MSDGFGNKHIVFRSPGVCAVEACDRPVPGANEVRIQTEYSLISTGTELTQLYAAADADSSWQPLLTYPLLPGYSNVGRVRAVGVGVDASMIGQRVVSLARHAQTVCRSVFEVVPVPESVSAEEAVFAVIAQIAMGGVRFSRIRLGETVAVFGAGLIGQFAARLARLSGAGSVFVWDHSPLRLRLLPDDSGVYPSTEDPEAAGAFIRRINRGSAADLVFDATGDPTRIAAEVDALEEHGRLVILSSPRGRSALDLNTVNLRGLSIIGAHNATVHMPPGVPGEPFTLRRDLQDFLERLADHTLSVASLITHRFPADRAPEAYHLLAENRREALGVLLDWR